MNRSVGTGALLCLSAQGPQNEYVEQYPTPSSVQPVLAASKKYYSVPLVTSGNTFLGTTVQTKIRSDTDMVTNIFLKFSLPPATYSELVGRAIFKEVSFLVDGSPVETLTDDWMILRDQTFLKADEKYATYKAVSNGVPEGTNCMGGDYYVPLEFFFCRRLSDTKHPPLPVCAMQSTELAVQFVFHDLAWITREREGDIIKPSMVVEYYTLSDQERVQYLNVPFSFKIPIAYKESRVEYKGNRAIINMTPGFEVDMIYWFIRNRAYENTSSQAWNSRYQWGYTTKYIKSTIPVTFFNGVTNNYVDTIDTATMYLNGYQILQHFPDGAYYSYKVPFDRVLSVPTKSIYIYSFADRPAELDTGGPVDFSQLRATTSYIDIIFKPEYLTDVQANYSLNVYFYGYGTLNVSDGRATFSV